MVRAPKKAPMIEPTPPHVGVPPTNSALFVGGTPTWGGVGSIIGAFFGALTITLIPSGAVGAGFAGYWTDFIFGFVIILTMIAHRFSGARVR